MLPVQSEVDESESTSIDDFGLHLPLKIKTASGNNIYSTSTVFQF